MKCPGITTNNAGWCESSETSGIGQTVDALERNFHPSDSIAGVYQK